MAHTELDLRERRAIKDMLNAQMPVSKIAADTARHETARGHVDQWSIFQRACMLTSGQFSDRPAR
ncbi:hypothetical protein PXK05_18295 [Phaeobacter gallaeciensis]|nr:hypothetical protein [Phaeobacter gallaeciensis]MDE4142341.1 hypothetical protein [Phaeobacter gallaeciensis]MDE4150786.1 hypothetical protein [Phaeobacter gallaeciensis]MDE4155015.1 hypothetical protein [Phaeobacter gallaeciensis]MDE4230405.1 hypothetical protein [Phaeobacter gallaeciensis]MDE4259482.1 hypothetical protein [Phaeobacter gallaeciensis]